MVTSAAQDLGRGVMQWRLWGRLGWLEIRRRYQRTVIGPFWTAISLSVLVIALGGVGSGLWGHSTSNYMPFLSAGLVVWLMISASITESCTLFISGTQLFRQMRFNYSILAFALTYRNLVTFAHNVTVHAIVLLIFAPGKIGPIMLLAIPGLALVVVNVVWIALLLGMACLRFRDLQQIVTTLMQIALFVTPIFWPPDNVSGMARVVYVGLNPLHHLIAIVRAPLIGEWPPLNSYIAVLAITVVGWGLAYASFSYFRRRIAYWS